MNTTISESIGSVLPTEIWLRLKGFKPANLSPFMTTKEALEAAGVKLNYDLDSFRAQYPFNSDRAEQVPDEIEMNYPRRQPLFYGIPFLIKGSKGLPYRSSDDSPSQVALINNLGKDLKKPDIHGTTGSPGELMLIIINHYQQYALDLTQGNKVRWKLTFDSSFTVLGHLGFNPREQTFDIKAAPVIFSQPNLFVARLVQIYK